MASANQAKPLETQPKPECRMKLPKPGCNVYNRIHVKNYRDVLMCGAGLIIGKGRNGRAHMHCTIGISVATPDTPNKIDAAKLAKELGVDMVLVNRGRILTIDEMEYQGGYIIDFHGVKMAWMAEMVTEDVFEQFKNPYLPSVIQRNTKWTWWAGKPVYLLREPNGTVWVMQEYTKEIDPTLTIDGLDQVGSKLKNLPKGWTFETKVLTVDLVLDTAEADGWASMLRDEVGCTYQACGYDSDTSANYIP